VSAGTGITAVLVSYKREQNLTNILSSLRATGAVSQIILWNNDPETHLVGGPDVTVINSTVNFKAYARYAAAMLAANDHILFQDDDIVLEPEIFEALHRALRDQPARIYGIAGRNLDEGRYRGEPAFGEVDIVLGQCMLFAKELLASVYGDMLRLAPIERGDDIAFSLLTGVKHFCQLRGNIHLPPQGKHALSKHPDHFRMRQDMVDRVLALKDG
jgi:GT2 family glycosyltransferase